jgi:hypothetical protein
MKKLFLIIKINPNQLIALFGLKIPPYMAIYWRTENLLAAIVYRWRWIRTDFYNPFVSLLSGLLNQN